MIGQRSLEERVVHMKNLDKIDKQNKLFGFFMSSIVMGCGFFIMIIPILRTLSIDGDITKDSISGFIVGLILSLFLPSIIYSIITMKTRKIEYVIIPAFFLLAAEYYFFHNFKTWISSDPNAAIGLLIIPIYLLLILVFSYCISYILLKIRKNIS